MNDRIFVFADWAGIKAPAFLGTLHSRRSQNKENFQFEYDDNAISDPMLSAVQLDPNIMLFSGPQFAPKNLPTFGAFADSSPDRWGRLLIKRRHEEHKRTGVIPKDSTLYESDFLLGVHDLYRAGGLRLKAAMKGAFLNDDNKAAAPPIARTAELERAAAEIEKGNVDNVSKWLKILIAPGGSLGGARPKASVLNNEKRLCIAKFPSVNDEVNVGAWEAVTNALAKAVGLNVANGLAEKYASDRHTFIVERFDRTPKGERIHFASAMTMLGKTDGYDANAGASYIEIAEALIRNGAEVDADLQELWSRIVFNMLVSNTDDHLRNHGFLLSPRKGWRLSPAYDLNPVAGATELKLNVNEVENIIDLDLALSVADFFRVKVGAARGIIDNQKKIIKKWRRVVISLGISRSEQEIMAPAFALAETGA